MAKAKVWVMVCDNPRCPNEPQITTEEDPAMGYYFGKGTWVLGGGGGPIPAIFADTSECIKPAMDHMIEEAQR